MPDSRPRLSRRLVDRLASPYVAGLAAHLDRVQDSVLALHARLDWIEAELHELPKREERINARIADVMGRVDAFAAETSESFSSGAADAREMRKMAKAISGRAYENRSHLYRLREHPEYEMAFSETEPVVTFVIPTFDRFELLRDRSLPSILGQNYENLEVIVSGDQSPPETAKVVQALADPRVKFIDRTVRGPYPEDPHKRWLMSGTPPLNDAIAIAKGRWIAILGDDDEVTPTHTEALLKAAQERRFEHCYGKLKIRFSDGGEMDWDSKFPPTPGHYTPQLAIFHAGLDFFQFEPSDVLFDEPNDWSLARRMVAAGVRFGMIDELVAYKHENRSTPENVLRSAEAAPTRSENET